MHQGDTVEKALFPAWRSRWLGQIYDSTRQRSINLLQNNTSLPKSLQSIIGATEKRRVSGVMGREIAVAGGWGKAERGCVPVSFHEGGDRRGQPHHPRSRRRHNPSPPDPCRRAWPIGGRGRARDPQLGGVDLEIAPREPTLEPPEFDWAEPGRSSPERPRPPPSQFSSCSRNSSSAGLIWNTTTFAGMSSSLSTRMRASSGSAVASPAVSRRGSRPSTSIVRVPSVT